MRGEELSNYTRIQGGLYLPMLHVEMSRYQPMSQ